MTNPASKARSEFLNLWLDTMIINSWQLIKFGADEEVMVEIINKCIENARFNEKVFYRDTFEKKELPKLLLQIARESSGIEEFGILTELENTYKHVDGLRQYINPLIIEKVLDDLGKYWLKNTDFLEILTKIERKRLKLLIAPKVKREKGIKGAPPQKLVRGLIFKINVAFNGTIPTDAYPVIAKFINTVTMKETIPTELAYQRINSRLNDMYKNAHPPKEEMLDEYLEKEEWTKLWKTDEE